MSYDYGYGGKMAAWLAGAMKNASETKKKLLSLSAFMTGVLLFAGAGCDSPLRTGIPDPSYDNSVFFQWGALIILSVGLAWTLFLIARDVRRRLKKEFYLMPAPLTRLLLIRLATYALLTATVLRLQKTTFHWTDIFPYALCIAWFTAVFLSAVLSARLKSKPPVKIIFLLIPDAAFVAAILYLMKYYTYLPNLPPFLISAAFIHLAFFAYRELRDFLVFKMSFMILVLCIVFAFGPVLLQQSMVLSDSLDAPGRASRIAETDGKVYKVYVDEKSGFVYYLRKDNPQTIYGIQPKTGRQVDFHDLRERFSNLTPGPDGTMAATSVAERGRSVLLFNLPDLSVVATFSAFNMEAKYLRYGPPAYDAVFSDDYAYVMTLGQGNWLINRCALPLDDSPARGDMGRNCMVFGLPISEPGLLFLDEKHSYLYVAIRGKDRHHNGKLLQLMTSDMKISHETNFPNHIADFAMSKDKSALYTARKWEKNTYFFVTQNPNSGLMARVHIFPSRLIADSYKQNLYVGSSLSGSVQILRLSDGWASRPILTGPGLNDMTLDETRQILYVATDRGIVAVNLKMIPMPTGALRIEAGGLP